MSCPNGTHDWSAEEYEVLKTRVCSVCNEYELEVRLIEAERRCGELGSEVARLRGLIYEIPLQSIEESLPRYGLSWNGPEQFVTVPMPDGYWTPWHISDRINKSNQIEHYRIMNERDDIKRHLGNLLARIHGDGGHYLEEHGIDKAVSDADDIVVNLFKLRNES